MRLNSKSKNILRFLRDVLLVDYECETALSLNGVAQKRNMRRWHHAMIKKIYLVLGIDRDTNVDEDWDSDECDFEFQVKGGIFPVGEKEFDISVCEELERVLSVLRQSGIVSEIDLRTGVGRSLRASWVKG